MELDPIFLISPLVQILGTGSLALILEGPGRNEAWNILGKVVRLASEKYAGISPLKRFVRSLFFGIGFNETKLRNQMRTEVKSGFFSFENKFKNFQYGPYSGAGKRLKSDPELLREFFGQ